MSGALEPIRVSPLEEVVGPFSLIGVGPSSLEALVDRPTSRVIVLDEADRILLFKVKAERLHTDLWITPGGGAEPGESPEAAARRELAEETGLVAPTLGQPVWVRHHVVCWAGVGYFVREYYYLLRTASFDLEVPCLDANEVLVTGNRWFTVDEILASDAVFSPRELGLRLATLLAGPPPNLPLHVGV